MRLRAYDIAAVAVASQSAVVPAEADKDDGKRVMLAVSLLSDETSTIAVEVRTHKHTNMA